MEVEGWTKERRHIQAEKQTCVMAAARQTAAYGGHLIPTATPELSGVLGSPNDTRFADAGASGSVGVAAVVVSAGVCSSS